MDDAPVSREASPWRARFELLALLFTIAAAGVILASVLQALAIEASDRPGSGNGVPTLPIFVGGANLVTIGCLTAALALVLFAPGSRNRGLGQTVVALVAGLATATIVLGLVGAEEILRRGNGVRIFTLGAGGDGTSDWLERAARLAGVIPVILLACAIAWFALHALRERGQ